MSENNRRIANARLLSEYEDIMRCPICSSPVRMVNLRSLICSNHHCFDLSKQGYVNLLSRPLHTKYDKKMFESRRTLSQNGLFDPLIARICANMLEALKPMRKWIKIMDAGCGEGSHLSNIQQRISEQSQCSLLGIGVDISKEAIRIASRNPSQTIWCVADLANCPIRDKQINFIVNVLSPSNYSEFHRILADDGMVIKVIPGREYLQELRAKFYDQTVRSDFSNESTLALFKHNFKLVDIQRVQYSVTMENNGMEQLVYMTPLSWGATEERILQVLSKDTLEVTFDFSVLLGKK